MNEKTQIKLPEGFFSGNCSNCIYANLRDQDDYGRVWCNNSNYGGYNEPRKRNGCFYWKG